MFKIKIENYNEFMVVEWADGSGDFSVVKGDDIVLTSTFENCIDFIENNC